MIKIVSACICRYFGKCRKSIWNKTRVKDLKLIWRKNMYQKENKCTEIKRQTVYVDTITSFNIKFKCQYTKYCHSPTQPQLNSAQFELEWLHYYCLTHPPHHPTPPQTFKALPGNLGSWVSECNLILTQLEETWRKRLGSPDPPPPPWFNFICCGYC